MPDTRIQNEKSFAAALVRLARLYRRAGDRDLIHHGLSEAKALPVAMIARLGEGVRQGVLADELGLEGPSLVRVLDQLCAAGLVERRDDPSDGRAKTLHLSEQGRATAAEIEEALQSLRHGLLSGVTDADLSATLRVFAAFEAGLATAAD